MFDRIIDVHIIDVVENLGYSTKIGADSLAENTPNAQKVILMRP